MTDDNVVNFPNGKPDSNLVNLPEDFYDDPHDEMELPPMVRVEIQQPQMTPSQKVGGFIAATVLWTTIFLIIVFLIGQIAKGM